MQNLTPVITFDGPSGSGKGTIAQKVAATLEWHYLDSGALYRTVAWATEYHHTNLENPQHLGKFVEHLNIRFDANPDNPALFCEGIPITDDIRSEKISVLASKVAAIPEVREALLKRQRRFRQPPGLVADGRDMGTVVFTDAVVKFYLTASAAERANRRYFQLKKKGISVSLRDIQEELEARDHRDKNRDVSPLTLAPDMLKIDTTSMNIEEVFHHVMQVIQGRIEV